MAVDEAGGKIEKLEDAFGRLRPMALGREFRCAACGYGIVVQREPPSCPMCGALSWVPRER